MKLNPSTQLGLAFDLSMRLNIFKLQKQNMDKWDISQQEQLEAFKEIEGLFSDNNNQFYVFRETALTIADRIKLDKGKLEDFSFLRTIKDKKVTYLMGKNIFYRWVKIGDDIYVGCVKTWEETESIPVIQSNNVVMRDEIKKGILYWLFKIDTESGKLIFPEESTNKEFEDMMMRFLRMLIFAELSELETVILKPKLKTGTRKSGKYINESPQDVTIVDSTWNKIMIKTDGFTVSGHLRLARIGEGRTGRKLILIPEFEKSGYIRRAPREIANEKIL